MSVNIHWFRHGLRLHDNPALLEAISDKNRGIKLLPVFIFDGESADADWSVCAGNWMWVSSSAFERLLDSSLVTCPVALAKRLDPLGTYIKQYVPELAKVPQLFIHEPWRMPLEEQEKAECLIGVHYPSPMIDLTLATERNMKAMRDLRMSLTSAGAPDKTPPHCRPSNEEEVRHFFWLAD